MIRSARYVVVAGLVGCGAGVDPGPPGFVAGDPASIARAQDLAQQYLRAARPDILSHVDALAPRSVEIDFLGGAHARLAQMVGGVPVLGGEVVVHLDVDGTGIGVTDRSFPGVGLVSVDPVPRLDPSTAIGAAQVAAAPGAGAATSTLGADLQVLHGLAADTLVYRVEVDVVGGARPPRRPVVFIDARTGAVVWRYENLQTLQREVYDLGHGTALPGTLARAEGGAMTGDVDVDASYAHVGATAACYAGLFGRDSYDGVGGLLRSSVHYGAGFANAYWNGRQMVFGDGDGVYTRSFTGALDVTAHELTHAVTERTSGLVYWGESGGLNEAMSDIFGNVCEWYRDTHGDVDAPPGVANFLVAEDITLTTPAMRYMADPARDGTSLDYWTSTAGSADVHASSGIANLAFYLLAQGGTHPRGKSPVIVTGIGMAAAARVFYLANTTELTPTATFADARAATLAAAARLFGPDAPQVRQVANAWAAVGVGPPRAYRVIDEQRDLSATTSGLAFRYTTDGVAALKFVLGGGTGNADLYVRAGATPTLESFDCRPWVAGNAEVCEFDPVQPGSYEVLVQPYQPFAGVTLTVLAADAVPPAPETACVDGWDDDGDGWVDCGDLDCASTPVCTAPWTTVQRSDFEAGWDGFVDGGSDAARVRAARFAASGRYCVQLRNGAGAASAFTSAALPTAGRASLRIAYQAMADSMEPGESYLVEVSRDGGPWQPVLDVASGTGFTNQVRLVGTLVAPVAGARSMVVRFRVDASSRSDFVYFDDVTLAVR